jgi:CheY-like chemotaxis protein
MHRVLLVDDDRDQRLLTWDTISMSDVSCSVRDAATAEEALEILRGGDEAEPYDPDVMYIDLEMPGMGGLALLRRIRREPQWAGTKVFVVSGSTDESGRREARRFGADGFVLKSSDVQQMMRDLRQTFCHWPQRTAGELAGSERGTG